MPQSLAVVRVHIVFSTKHRKPMIEKPMQPRLHAFLASHAREMGAEAYIVGGVEDHVHLLVDLGRQIMIAELIKELKRISNGFMRTHARADFRWQAGYGAFSVSHRDIDDVREYIANQEEHHKKISFADEFLQILKEHDAVYDERYLWD